MAKPTELPQWGTLQTNEAEPVAQKTAGWAYQAPVISSYMNWFKRIVYDWVTWIDTIFNDFGVNNRLRITTDNAAGGSAGCYVELNDSSGTFTNRAAGEMNFSASAGGFHFYPLNSVDVTVGGNKTFDLDNSGNLDLRGNLKINTDNSGNASVTFGTTGNDAIVYDPTIDVFGGIEYAIGGGVAMTMSTDAFRPNIASINLGGSAAANRWANAYMLTAQANGAAPTISGSDDLTTRHGANAVLACGKVIIPSGTGDPTVQAGSWNLDATTGVGFTRRVGTGWYIIKLEQAVDANACVFVNLSWGGNNIQYEVRSLLSGSNDQIDIHVYDREIMYTDSNNNAMAASALTDDGVSIQVMVVGAPA